MVNKEFVERWVRRLRREAPDAVAIFLGGSQLRGDAGPASDVDFDIVVAHGPRDEWPAWFEMFGDRLVRIDTWIRDVGTWLTAADEPQAWAFFLPCADPLQLCWASDESWRQRLDRTQVVYRAGPPEIDHFPGDVGKVANAWHGRDELALRLAAQDLARTVVTLLHPLNPRPAVHSRLAALRSLLDFDVVPAGYHHDMPTCLGLAGNATGADVWAAARRLANGVLELVHAHDATIIEHLTPHAARALHDGSLRRLVEQTLANPGPDVRSGVATFGSAERG